MQDLEPHLKRGRDGGVSRPKELKGSLVGREEEFGMGFRPEEVGLEGVWLFKGPVPSISGARAPKGSFVWQRTRGKG